MKKRTLKTLVITLCLSLSCIGIALAFDWPQKETAADMFYSYFAQLRGSTIESSLIFKDGAEVSAAGDGTVTTIIREHNGDMGWFESTLGNAVIISHDNKLMTVYANLDEQSLAPSLSDEPHATTGMYIGQSGNSGWQQGQSSLEFIVLDTKNHSAINPRTLMPRVGQELPLVMGQITIEAKDGTQSVLSQTKNLTAGNYRIYRERQTVAVPYKTNISINGTSIESMQYDSLREVDGKLCVRGNSWYPLEQVYPDEKRQLLGQVFLAPGRNIITLTISDITGLPSGTKTVSYTVAVR